MYDLALLLHSWLRWAVLLLGVLAIGKAAAGRSSGRWTRGDDIAGAAFVGMLDFQLLIGLLLYFALSPITRAGMSDIGAAMGNAGLRFWTVEHLTGMLIGLSLAHVGRVKARKTSDAFRKHRTTLLFFTLALIVILLSIPWPGRSIGRPMFRTQAASQALEPVKFAATSYQCSALSLHSQQPC